MFRIKPFFYFWDSLIRSFYISFVFALLGVPLALLAGSFVVFIIRTLFRQEVLSYEYSQVLFAFIYFIGFSLWLTKKEKYGTSSARYDFYKDRLDYFNFPDHRIVNYHDVKDVFVKQSFIQKFFKRGSIIIMSPNASELDPEIRIDYIPDIHTTYDKIMGICKGLIDLK